MLDDPPDQLFHYTCRDRLDGITADRRLIPNPHPLLGEALVWLTDLDVPDRQALGLTSAHLLTCDRTAVRVIVQTDPSTLRWSMWARRARVPSLARALLEGGGALPKHWWVSAVPMPVRGVRVRDEMATS
jgi:hypothetical protein